MGLSTGQQPRTLRSGPNLIHLTRPRCTAPLNYPTNHHCLRTIRRPRFSSRTLHSCPNNILQQPYQPPAPPLDALQWQQPQQPEMQDWQWQQHQPHTRRQTSWDPPSYRQQSGLMPYDQYPLSYHHRETNQPPPSPSCCWDPPAQRALYGYPTHNQSYHVPQPHLDPTPA